MKKINVNSYDIWMESGLLSQIRNILEWGNKYVIITDTNVAKLYGNKLAKKLKAEIITVPSGEKSKSMATAEKLLTQLSKKGITRNDAIIALGGGVVGDLAGFVASVYMRGINYIQIPTTLLAMVDSSIGGKTAVNLETGKNLAGTFYPPKAVLIDQNILKTLPHKEILNGFAEIIKYAVIKDKSLFRLLEKKREKILQLDPKLLNKIITRCCQIKASIVKKDEKEGGLRRVLNYGHTAGHAIELINNYKISHGAAIAEGMVLINKIAKKKDLLKEKEEVRINNLIINYGLLRKPAGIKADQLWAVMQHDKKVKNGKINFVVATKIGKAEITNKITKKAFS